MKFLSGRFASSAVLLAALASLTGCGDDESSGTGGGGGEAATSTTGTPSSSSTNQSSSSATTSTGQGEAGGGTGTGGDGTGGSGTGGDGTGGDGTGGKGDGGGGGGSGICLPTATTVDLADVVARATELAEDTLDTQLGEPKLYFQDGLNAVGFFAPNDMGAIIAAFEVPDDLAVIEDEVLVYRASVWGVESVWMARVIPWEGLSWDVETPDRDEYFQYYTTSSGVGLLAEGVGDDDAEALAEGFAATFPGAELIPFPESGTYIFTNVAPPSLADAFAFLNGRAEVSLVEPDGEVYAPTTASGRASICRRSSMTVRSTSTKSTHS